MVATRVIDDHNELENLAVGDFHSQYLLLAGRAGGQIAFGGTAITDSLDLYPNTQSPPVNFATDGFINIHGRILFLGFADLTGVPGINYQLMFHGETVDCSGQGSIIPQGFWYQPTFDYNTAQTFGGAATFQDGSIWRESALIAGPHNTFSLGSYLGGPRYQVGHAGVGLPPSGLYGFNSTPAADLVGGTSLTMPAMAGYSTNFPFPLQTFLGLQPLRNGAVCTRYSHFIAYSAIANALTLHGGSTITTEVGLDLQNLARGTTAISIFSDALGAYMDHAGLITYTGGVLRLGTAAVSGHGLGAGDVLIGADLEVDGITSFDGPVTIQPLTAVTGLTIVQTNNAKCADLSFAGGGSSQIADDIYVLIKSSEVASSPSGGVVTELDLEGSSAIGIDLAAIHGRVNFANKYSSGTVSQLSAGKFFFGGFNTGTVFTVSEGACVRLAHNIVMGVNTTRFGALWIENLDPSGVTNLHPIYQIGPNGMNYFGSKTQIEQKESNQYALLVSRNINEAGALPLVRLIEDHTGSSQAVLGLQNDGTGPHVTTLGTNEDLELDPNGTGLTRAMGGARVDSADAIYFGNPSVDGSWRIIRDTNDFSFQRRESSAWVEKGAFTAV